MRSGAPARVLVIGAGASSRAARWFDVECRPNRSLCLSPHNVSPHEVHGSCEMPQQWQSRCPTRERMSMSAEIVHELTQIRLIGLNFRTTARTSSMRIAEAGGPTSEDDRGLGPPTSWPVRQGLFTAGRLGSSGR